jgi:hypothetical protein
MREQATGPARDRDRFMWLIRLIEGFVHIFKELLDAMQSDGGHLFLALFLVFTGLGLIGWGPASVAEHAEALYTAMVAILTYSMRGTGKANGAVRSTTTTTTSTQEEKKTNGNDTKA